MHPPRALVRLLLPLLPLLATRRPRARLRPVEYRGVTSAAMSYDQLPIIDVFRSPTAHREAETAKAHRG